MRLLSLSGFVPEHICDTVRFTQFTGDRNISHYCGYASDFISQVLADNSINGAVYPRSCDSTRIISSYLQSSGKFFYQINVPSFNVSGSEEYFADSLRNYKEAIENYFGIRIEDIEERVHKVNSRNDIIRKAYNRLPEMSYSAYLFSIHEMLKKPLYEQNPEFGCSKKDTTDKTVYVVGSFLSNLDIVERIEQSGMTVVGDSLPESGRLASTPDVKLTGNIYKDIAKSMLSSHLSPTQNGFGEIIKRDVEEIRKKDVKGLIFIMQKYCEPYEYLYTAYKSSLDKLGISTLKLSLNDTEDDRKAGLMLEAFSDII